MDWSCDEGSVRGRTSPVRDWEEKWGSERKSLAEYTAPIMAWAMGIFMACVALTLCSALAVLVWKGSP